MLALILLSSGLNAFLIPVVDVGSWLAEGVTFAEELGKIINFVKLYQKFKHILDQRVDKLKKGFGGLEKEALHEMSAFSDDIFKTLQESGYYAPCRERSIFERVGKGEKLLDVIRETVDLEKELNRTVLAGDPRYKEYLDEQYECYREQLARLEERMKYLNFMREAGSRRLKTFSERRRLFEDTGAGKTSKLGGTVGSEARAVALLSESMLETALQEQEIAALMRLKFEEILSRALNGLYLNNHLLLIQQEKRRK